MFELKNQVALVTGASAGLGEHFARVLASAGAKVIVAARRTDKLQALVESLGKDRAAAVAMDVTDGDSIRAGFDAAEQAFGPLSIVVNNAGITAVKDTLQMTDADWDQVSDTNLRGAWLVAQTAARHMVAAKKANPEFAGRIVNIASITGIRTIGQIPAYAAAKAALIHLTKVLAMEWARHGIQVNALAPGYIETDLNRDFWQTPPGQALIKRVPQRRLGKPSDLDGPLLLLCSDAGAFMTGATIVVDGGHTVSAL